MVTSTLARSVASAYACIAYNIAISALLAKLVQRAEGFAQECFIMAGNFWEMLNFVKICNVPSELFFVVLIFVTAT